MSSKNGYTPITFGANNSYIPQYGYEAPEMFNRTGGFDLSGNSSMLDYGNPNAGSNFRMSELVQAPITNAAFNMGGSLMPQTSFMDKMGSSDFWLGGIDKASGNRTMGAAAPLMQGAGALMSGFMGMKQYGLSKKVFENNKQQFERNFNAQKGVTNMALEDKFTRQNNDMVANGMTPTRTVEESMKRYGVA